MSVCLLQVSNSQQFGILLQEWGTEGSCWGGPLLHALQRHGEPSWRSPVQEEGLLGDLDEGQALISRAALGG